MEYHDLLVDSILGLFTLVTIGFLGSIISRGFGIFTRIIMGASLVASLVSALVGFNAQLGHRVILLSVFLGVMWRGIFFFRNKTKLFFSFNFDLVIVLIFFIVFLFASIVRLKLSTENGVVLNAHEAYYLGIPVEINRNDYASRLRVMDNYPSEWSKYHFFNSSLLSIPMVFMSHQDLAGFLVAKSLILAVFVGVGLELIGGSWRRKSFLIALISLVYLHAFDAATKWSLNTTNFTSVFFILLLFSSIWKRKIFLACFSSLSLCLTASRLIVPGLSILIFLVLQESRHRNFRFKNAKTFFPKLICILVLAGSISSTVFLGESPSNFSSPTRALYDFLYRAFWTPYYLFTSPDWQTSMSSTTSILTLFNSTSLFSGAFEGMDGIQQQLQEMSNFSIFFGIVWWCILLFLSIKITWFKKEALKNFFYEASRRLRYLFVILMALIPAWLLICVYRGAAKLMWPFSLSILPIAILVILSPSKLRPYLAAYVTSAYLLIPLFDAGVWTPAVSLVEFLLPLFLFIRFRFSLNFQSFKQLQMMLIMLFVLTTISSNTILNEFSPISYDNTSHIIAPKSSFKPVSIVCSSAAKEDRLIMSIAGQRIAANFDKNNSLTVTRYFSIYNEEVRRRLIDLCGGNGKVQQ